MLASYQQPEDNRDPYLFEEYDSQQVQSQIEQSDAKIQLLTGIAQGMFLVGIQSLSVQSLYAVGTTGMFPVVVASIPVFLAFGVSLNTITIDNGLSISDIGKFSAGLLPSGILTLSSCKLYFDNEKADSVAKLGISTIKSQLDTYEKRPEKPGFTGDGWLIMAALGVGVVIALVIKNKKK